MAMHARFRSSRFLKIIALASMGLWLLPGLVFAANPAPDDEVEDTKASNDFVVSGEDKFKVRSEKILRSLFVDMDKPVQDMMMQSSELSREILPDQTLEINERAGMLSTSQMTFSPWLSLITKQPVLVISSPRSDALKIRSWKFQVTDEAGQELYSRSGGSSLPAYFEWDGRCADGGLIEMGESFFYTITLIDQGNNPLVTTSKPKKLYSLAYYRGNQLNVWLLSSLIFDDKIRTRFSDVGKSFMKEACDYIVKDIGRTTKIQVTSSDQRLGQAQGEAIQAYLVERLALPADDIQVVVAPSQNPRTESVLIQCVR